jgi:hypothetical protein
MNRFVSTGATLVGFALSAFLLSGCGVQESVTHQTSIQGDAHDHGHEGPHGGHLVELGNEDYHAEVVHDDKNGTVSVYVLDGTAKNPVAIDAADVNINVTHEDGAEQFKLVAAPDASDPQGKSSCFRSRDANLAADLDSHGHQAHLVLSIDGKQYRGTIEHHHHH